MALLVRDPKTIEMRDEMVTFFGQEEADWKAEQMRFHESQQQRNLNVRGYGFDERILRLNQETAARVLGMNDDHMGAALDGAPPQEVPPEEAFAESFEIELWENGRCA